MPAIPPTDSQPTQPSSSDDSVQAIKNYCNNLSSNSQCPVFFARDLANAVDNLSNVIDIKNAVQSFINQPSPYDTQFDVYLCYGTTNFPEFLDGVVKNINNMISTSGWVPKIEVPAQTLMDQIYSGIGEWRELFDKNEGAQLVAAQIAANIQDPNIGIGSYATAAQLSQVIASILTSPDLFNNYPDYGPVTYSDLESLMTGLQTFGSFTIPDFTQYYLQLGYKSSPTSMETALLQQMRNIWTTGSTASLLAWVPTLFNVYPGVSVSDITTIAQDLGVTLPPSFSTTFNAMVSLLPSDPNAPDYKMIVDFQHQWITEVFANSAAWDAGTWFDNNYGTPGQSTYPPGITDLYLRYPGADASMIQSLVNLIIPGAPAYQATSFDNQCRAIYAEHGTEVTGFWHDLIIAYQNAGSSDNNQGLEQWIDSMAVSGFQTYPEMTVSDIMTFLNGYPFKISATGDSPICDYVSGYIINIWEKEPGRTPDEIKFGNQVIAQILATAPSFSSFQDFKTYIDGQIPNFEKKWPGIPPATITGLFELFGLYP